MANFERQFNLLFSAKDGASSAIKRMGDAAAASAKDISKLQENLQFLKILQIAEYALKAATFVFDLGKEAVNAADAFGDLAERTGVSVESISKLAEVAEFSDVSLETLGKALNTVNVKAVETPDIFRGLGIEVLDAAGKMKSSDTLFKEVADSIEKINDPARQAALATDIFGKAGLELLPILKQGSAGIEELEESAVRFGAVVSQDLADQSSELNDNIQKIKLAGKIAGKGAINSLLRETLPSFNLLLSTFIEYNAASIDVADQNQKMNTSFEDLATGKGFKALIATVGFVGDFIQGIFQGVETYVSIFKNTWGSIFTYMFALGEAFASLTRGDFQGVKDAFLNLGVQLKENAADLSETWEENWNPKKFSDTLNEAVKAAVDGQEKTLGKSADSIQAYGDVIVKNASIQMRAVGDVAKEAGDKAKKAADDQRKVAEEFEALAKRLKALTPGGSLDQRLSKVSKDASNASKEQARQDAKNAAAGKLEDEGKIKSLQERADLARQAYSENGSLVNESIAKEAEQALAREKNYQAEQAQMKELQALDRERNADALSEDQKSATRSAIASEVASIYAQIEENKKTGTTNEVEIDRLKAVGKVLEDNKDKATGVFSSQTISEYADELKKLATDASDTDAARAKAAADEAYTQQLNILTQLKDDVSAIKVGLDTESVKKMAEQIETAITDQLKAVKVNLGIDAAGQSAPSVSAPAFANGGIVNGPGTGRQDNLLAWLSSGEHVMPNHRMKVPGMASTLEALRNGADPLRLLKGLGRYADGGIVGASKSSPSNSNWSIDLRTNSGNISLGSSMSQEQLALQTMMYRLKNR